MADNERVRVAVLLGGDSSERPVSFSSGIALANALSPERYAVTVFDVASPATRANAADADLDAVGNRPRHAYLPVEWNQLTTTLYTSGFQVALPALHGGWGEDGTLQALLEVAGIPYVGSRPSASMIAMDKQVCKAVLAESGVPVPAGVVVNNLEELEQAQAAGKVPDGGCVVKPNRGGSSVAVAILRRRRDGSGDFETSLRRSVEAALADGSGALVEEWVRGCEVTAAVVGEGASARVLPLIEIVPDSEAGFYDYEAKYKPGRSQHVIPPRITEAVASRVAELALLAHRRLGCRGVARSDFVITEDGTPYFLEINTVPGMTQTSLVPDAARASGLSFEEFVEGLVNDALGR